MSKKSTGKPADNSGWSVETHGVRTGQHRTQEGEHSEPIFTTSSYVFDSAAHAAARFSGEEPGNIYSRFTNPTVQAFEERLAAIEGGERCVGTASGMVAILSACLALLKAGDHIVCSQSVFGSTILLLKNYLGRFGVETTFVPLTDLDAWDRACRKETRMLILETPSNPLLELVNISEVAEVAHRHGAWLAVDNTLCTGALQKPLDLGADLSILSATKYIDGQGRCVGGAIVGNSELVGKEVYGFMRSAGPSLSPFNAWVFLKGLETLSLRMKAHSENALALATWLEAQDKVERVYYPGLKSHPQHALAGQQQGAYGGLLSFDIKGGKEQAWRFIDATRLISITANLGDTKTTVTHPATTTHGRISPEERQAAGIGDNLIRIAVGLEGIDDLKNDLQLGLEAI
jgi:O-succinylhomoserine sulfhydrylase